MIPFNYSKQIKKFLVQFMSIFNGLEVEVGATSTRPAGLISVPIHYSSMDKVAASIMAGGTSNKPIRLPVMSVDLIGIRQDPRRSAGLNQVHSQTYMPQGGYFASDVKTLSRLMPVAMILDLDLAIWASNDDQHFQILEQIITLFNPSVQIQTSDASGDWTKISMVTLNGLRLNNNNYPLGTANRTIVSNLTFEIPIYLSAPANVKDEFVKKVQIRLATLDTDQSFDNLLEQFDAMGAEYDTVASVQDIEAQVESNKAG